jgi:hypothetical protein
VKRKLHLIIERLFPGQRAVRHGIRFEGERRRHAVLILAEHFGKRGPTAGDRLVLEQHDGDGWNQDQDDIRRHSSQFARVRDEEQDDGEEQKNGLIRAREQVHTQANAQ